MTKTEKLDARYWVEKYADYLYSFAFYRVRDEDAANDLVQDTFLSALEKAASFEGNCTELTWLRTILRNKVIDFYRKQSSGLNVVSEPQETVDEHNDFFEESGIWTQKHAPQAFFGTDGFDKLTIKEFYRVLEYCLQKLPALWMSVFKMKHLDDEKAEVICQSLKISDSNYWVIIHRAKLNLRECLQKNWM